MVGKFVSVGAGSVLRSATVEDEAVVGLRCVLLEGCIVEKSAALAAGTVVEAGHLIPGGQLWEGNPARYVRNLTADELAELPKIAKDTAKAAAAHADEFLPYGFAYVQAEELRNKLMGAA